MIAPLKCYDNNGDVEYSNAFEVSISNTQPQWECKIYNDIYSIKGVVRISQSLNLEHKAPIDMIVFLDKESAKLMRMSFLYLKSPYNDDKYNYKIVKDILGMEQFNYFMKYRFNYTQITLELDIGNMAYLDKIPAVFFADFKVYFDLDSKGGVIPVATIIKATQTNQFIELCEDSDIIYMIDNDLQEVANNRTDSATYNIKYPIIRGVYAQTSTKENNYIVNVKDKPSVKEGNIIMQLYSQKINPNDKSISYDLYDSEVFYEWLNKQREIQKAYFITHKDSLINPFLIDDNNDKDYIIFIDDILENDWAKIRVLRYNRDDNIDAKDYINLFLNHPSSITIANGYIHSSGLEPLSVFSKE